MFKISNEVKVALLAIVAVTLAIAGFKFLQGTNVLTTSNTYYVKYDHVDQLRPSSPVFIKGFQVGMVKDVHIDPQSDTTIIVVLDIDGSVDVPKDAVAIIVSQSIMGGKAVDLHITHPCEGGDCAPNKSYLTGRVKGALESIIGEPSAIDAYTKRLKSGLSINLDSLARTNPESMAGSLLALDQSLRNIELMTRKINAFLDVSTKSFQQTGENAAKITGMLSASGEDIKGTIANLEALSTQLKNANLDQSAKSATTAIDSITASLKDLRLTLKSTDRTISRVDTLAQNLVMGKGTAGQFLTDPKLYENLTRLTYHLEILSQDFRLHPERYTSLKVKIFGKPKVNRYDYPNDDPAYQLFVDSLRRVQSYPPIDTLKK